MKMIPFIQLDTVSFTSEQVDYLVQRSEKGLLVLGFVFYSLTALTDGNTALRDLVYLKISLPDYLVDHACIMSKKCVNKEL